MALHEDSQCLCSIWKTDLIQFIQMCRGVLAEYGSVAKYCSDNASVPVLMMPPASASLEPADPGPSLLAKLHVHLHLLWLQTWRASGLLPVKTCAEAASCTLLPRQGGTEDPLDIHHSGKTRVIRLDGTLEAEDMHNHFKCHQTRRL